MVEADGCEANADVRVWFDSARPKGSEQDETGKKNEWVALSGNVLNAFSQRGGALGQSDLNEVGGNIKSC